MLKYLQYWGHLNAESKLDILNPFPNDKFFRLFQTERVCRRQFQVR